MGSASASGVSWRNLRNWKRDKASATQLSAPGMCCIKSVKLCHAAIKKSVRMNCIRAVFCGTSVPNVHHCVIVAMDKEPLPSPMRSPYCSRYKNGKELLPLDVSSGLLPGPAAVQPVASPVTAVAKLAGISVELESRRWGPLMVQEESFPIPLRREG